MLGTPASTVSPRCSSRARCAHHPHRSSPDHLMGAVRKRRTRRGGNTVSSGPAELDWSVRRSPAGGARSAGRLSRPRSAWSPSSWSACHRSITRQPLTVPSPWPIVGPVSPDHAHEVRMRSQSWRPSAFVPGVVKVPDMGMGSLRPDVGSIHAARVPAAIAEVFTEIVRWVGR